MQCSTNWATCNMPTGIINLFAPKMSSCQYNFSGDYRDVHSLIGQGLHQCIDIVKQMLPTDGSREENPRIEREIYIYVIMYLKLFVFLGSLCLFFFAWLSSLVKTHRIKVTKARRLCNICFFFFQERYFREQQQELNTWNQNFWGKQNEKFNKVGYVIFYFLKNR